MTSDNEKQQPADELPTTPISEDRQNDRHSSEGKGSLKTGDKDLSDEEAKKEAKGSFKDFVVDYADEQLARAVD